MLRSGEQKLAYGCDLHHTKTCRLLGLVQFSSDDGTLASSQSICLYRNGAGLGFCDLYRKTSLTIWRRQDADYWLILYRIVIVPFQRMMRWYVFC